MILIEIINAELGEKYSFLIKPDNTTRNKFYCVMQNPFNEKHDTKVLYGGSPEIVERKIFKQYEKFKKEDFINE